MSNNLVPEGYAELLESLKARIANARIKAALSVNRELIMLYWEIGGIILERQKKQSWGTKVIEQLAYDLRREFPEMKGLSRANLFYIRAFAEAYPNKQIVQQLVGQLPWGHNILILTKIKDSVLREWYARACIENGWSRNILEAQIETSLHKRKGNAQTNFTHTLLSPQSELAHAILKDPYNFDFLTLHDEAVERDLQQGLLNSLRDFMLELGVGFAFIGSNYHLEVAGEDFYLDMLFYHLKLRCYVIVELKMGKFKPEYAGKINFYLSAVDDILRNPQDNPSIGILLCKTKSRVIVEYALKDIHKPLGVAEYRLAEQLSQDLKNSLPTVEQLEAELKALDSKK